MWKSMRMNSALFWFVVSDIAGMACFKLRSDVPVVDAEATDERREHATEPSGVDGHPPRSADVAREDTPVDTVEIADAGADVQSDASVRQDVIAWTDGSRLKARWYDLGGGTRVFAGWYDAMLRQNCAFLPAGDGQLRCVPGDPRGSYTSGRYLDSACAKEVPIFGKGASPCDRVPTVIRVDDWEPPCGPHYRAFRVRLVTKEDVFQVGGGGCTSAAGDYSASDRLFTQAEEVAASILVKGVVTPLARQSVPGTEIYQIVGDDGARSVPVLRDAATKEDCAFHLGTDGRPRCVASFQEVIQDKRFSAPGYSGYDVYSDASCTMYLARQRGAECNKREPTLALVSKNDVCPRRQTWVKLAPVAGSVWVANGGKCELQSFNPSVRYYSLGSAASIDSLPIVDRQINRIDHQARGRLRDEAFVLPEGVLIPTGRVFDSLENDFCRLESVGDGRFRCVTGRQLYPYEEVGFAYADALCAEPVFQTWGDACPDTHVPAYDPRNCAEPRTFYRVGPRHSGSVFSPFDQGTRGACRPFVLDGGYVAYRTTRVPQTTFAEVTLSNPP